MTIPNQPTLSVGASLSENVVLTPTKLHDLVNESFLSNMGVSALYTGLDYVRVTAEASPSQGDCYVADDGSLQIYDGSAYAPWGMASPYTITLVNRALATVYRGMAVVVARTEPIPSFAKSSSPNTDPTVVGIVYDTSIIGGASGQILVRGKMDDCVVEAGGSTKPAGSLLQGPTTGRSYALVDDKPETSPKVNSAYFGIALEEVPDLSVASFVTISAYIWR